jgi:hypothetical protein
MALSEIEQAQKLARAALALQPNLTIKYVRARSGIAIALCWIN